MVLRMLMLDGVVHDKITATTGIMELRVSLPAFQKLYFAAQICGTSSLTRGSTAGMWFTVTAARLTIFRGSGPLVPLPQIDRFIHDGVRTTPASKGNQTRALGTLHAL
jgi:hypothetical protein